MYKNQLQELAQRSCFNLPSYACIREGPDHAPRFKATVNFNGETFESTSYCSTLRQAEHSAAEVALNALASRGPSNSLATRILDETGVYKNLLQEVSQRVGASLPAYTTFRSGLGHLPIFTCTVELAGIIFTGEPAKNKKQAEKNAAMAAWLSLKSLQHFESSTSEKTHKDEQEHVAVSRALQKYITQAKLAKLTFPIKFPTSNPRSSSTQQHTATSSKILPLICPRAASHKPAMAVNRNVNLKTARTTQSQPVITSTNENPTSLVESHLVGLQKFPAAGAAPYIPVRHFNQHHRIAPPVTVRNAIPVFSASPFPPRQAPLMIRPPTLGMAPPVCIRQAVPVFASAPPIRIEELPMLEPTIQVAGPRISRPLTSKVEEPSGSKFSRVRVEDTSVSRAAPTRLDESQLSKVHLVRIEEPLGSKLQPMHVGGPLDSEFLAVQVEPPVSHSPVIQVKSPVSMVIGTAASSKSPGEENKIAAQDNLQESAEIEGFKELKI